MSLSRDCNRDTRDPKFLSSLDQFDIGCGLFDKEQQLFFCNETFKKHGDYPAHQHTQGTSFAEIEPLNQRQSGESGQSARLINRRCADLDDGSRMVISQDVTDQQTCAQDLLLANDARQSALNDLVDTQLQLGDAERLAALGELTAGVAHEIKNPLNFINNFSHVSLDLLDEIVETITPAIDVLDQEARDDVEELLGLVRQNFIKINQHGRRADSIIRTMLMHARRGPGETQTAPLNHVIEEVISLARQDLDLIPQDRPVNIMSSFSPDVGMIECFPEDLVRALLNLVANGIDATRQHDRQARPEVAITTRSVDDRIEISIRDNGAGMPDDVLDQALVPFFTTKPPGEGTGLGLSLTHDIICRQHRGNMSIASEPGMFTEINVTLFKNLPERRSGGRRRDDG